MVIIGANQKVISIPALQEYLELQNISSFCLGLLRVVVCGKAPVLQKVGGRRETQGLLRFTLKHGRPIITLKNIFTML